MLLQWLDKALDMRMMGHATCFSCKYVIHAVSLVIQMSAGTIWQAVLRFWLK